MSESYIKPSKDYIQPMVIGENINAYDVCYVASDGKMWKTDADAEATSPAIAIAVESGSAEGTIKFLFHGFISNPSWTLTIGGIVYLSETPGEIVQTAPSGTNDVIQPLGVAVSATQIYFNPSLMIIVHA